MCCGMSSTPARGCRLSSLSCQPEEQYAVDCLRAGAAAFVNKESAPNELAMAAKKIPERRPLRQRQTREKLDAVLDESAGKALARVALGPGNTKS